MSTPKTMSNKNMRTMKRLLIALLACTLILGVAPDVQAQTKKKTTKTTKTTKKKGTSAKSGTTKKAETTPAAPRDIVLPVNSNDCLFAIPLQLDRPYGPTNAPDGSGRMM